MTRLCSFRVDGVPVTQGNKTALRTRRGKKIMVDQSNMATKTRKRNALYDWRAAVGWSAKAAYKGEPTTADVIIAVRFYLPRPKSVKRARPSVKPDLGKLVRAVEDALTGIVWKDDAQVVGYSDVGKEYADGRLPGVEVDVLLLDD